jgi:integrase
MDTNKNIDKLLEKLLSFGEEQVHNICFFMLNSGLRMKEVIDAKFSDIDFKTGTLQIVVPRSNLFNKEKVIKLNQISLTLLAKIRDQYPNDTWVFQSKNKKNQINSHPKALSYQSALNTIKKIQNII